MLNDLRYGLRRLLKQPGFTATAIITLALGIGANTAIFSVVNGVLLRPLPFKNPNSLVMVWNMGAKAAGGDRTPLAAADVIDWRAQSHAFESIAAFEYGVFNYVGGETPEQVFGVSVTANFVSTLGAGIQLGRDFQASDENVGAPRVALLSDRFWRSHFGGDPNVLGRSVNLSGMATTIIGVMSPGVDFPYKDVALWRAIQVAQPTRRGPYFLSGLARLKPGVDIQQAKADTRTVRSTFDKHNLDFNLLPVSEFLLGDVRPALLALLIAVSLVLIIAAVNVANLTLVRTASRTKEISIRAALGARRGDLIRQLLTESLLLSIASGMVGVLFALWGVSLIVRFAPTDLPRIDQIRVDPFVLFWTVIVSLLTGLIFGIVPALQSSRFSLSQMLRETAHSSTEAAAKRRWRNALVVAELALAVTLIAGGGLLLKSLWRLHQVNLGINKDRLLTMQMQLRGEQYQDERLIRDFYSQLTETIRHLPGVHDAAVSTSLPPDLADFSSDFTIEGQGPVPNGEPQIAYFISVSPEYFRVLNIPLRGGRAFEATDNPERPGVTIINETFRRRFFPGEDPVGKRLNLGSESQPRWNQIVGVAEDVKYNGIAEDVQPAIYLAAAQSPSTGMSLIIQSDGVDPLSLTSAVRAVVKQLESQLPVSDVLTMDDRISVAMSQPRFRTTLITLFAVMALILACLGIYSVLSYSVVQRTHEIGVRMALGAQSRDVLGMVIRQALVLTLAGVVLGLVASYFVTGLMAKLLFGVKPNDLPTFAATTLVLIGTALISSYFPARRATKVDPLVALRYE